MDSLDIQAGGLIYFCECSMFFIIEPGFPVLVIEN